MAERHLRAVRGGDEPSRAAARPDDGASRSARLDALLSLTARGDAGAFEELYDAISASVLGLALRVVRDRDMAEDVAQEVLVEVWRRAARFDRSQGTARSWILTIAHRRAVDRVRSEQAHGERLRQHGAQHEVDPERPDHIVDTMHREWESARVRAGLAHLTERQREAIEITYYQGRTHREMAQLLGIPLGTAKARVRDGLIKLRDAWEVES